MTFANLCRSKLIFVNLILILKVWENFRQSLGKSKSSPRVYIMVHMGRRLLRAKEPNLLIESKQKLTREELLVWSWCLVNARFWITDGDGRELMLEELEQIKKKKEVFYALSEVDLEELRRRFPQHFNKDKVRYWRDVLKGLEKKIGFEVNYDLYKQTLEELGFDYILKKFKQNRAEKYFGLATIMAVGLSIDGILTITYTPLVAPLLVLLKKWFTVFNFEEVLNLELKASIVFYRIFKEKLGLKRNEFELSKEELLELLDLKNLTSWDLRRDYIEPAVKEINEKTRLKVEAEPVRRGRGGKIVGFRFRVEEEPRLEEATTKDLVENFDLLRKWFKKTIQGLTSDLSLQKEIRPIDIVNSLLTLKRINPAVAIWFLLHYPKSEAKLYALEHIKWVEDNTKLEYPERYLQHAIQTPKKEYQFLLDQRVKHEAWAILRELKEEMEEKERTKTQNKKAENTQEVLNVIVEEILAKVKLLNEDSKQKLKEILGVEIFRDYLTQLIREKNIPKLQKVLVLVQEILEEQRQKEWDELVTF